VPYIFVPYPPFLTSTAAIMHGKWTAEHNVFVIALRMGTNFDWNRIAQDFRTKFQTTTTPKDVESRWNKNLKDGELAKAVDDFRHSGVVDTDSPHAFNIARIIKLLADYPAAERVF